MSRTAPQVFEVTVRATCQQVWEALTSPELTARYAFETAIDAPLEPGGPYAYRRVNGEAAGERTVLELEPPRRLRLTSRFLFDANARAEPPHRVTWEIEERPRAGSLVRVTCDGYAGETASARIRADGMEAVRATSSSPSASRSGSSGSRRRSSASSRRSGSPTTCVSSTTTRSPTTRRGRAATVCRSTARRSRSKQEGSADD
ncbi:MAG: SRPBCC domain-containing protein [Candidatus Limnocylindria bacterium]